MSSISVTKNFRNAKVNKKNGLLLIILTSKYVFWFEISMNNRTIVNFFDNRDKLISYEQNSFQREFPQLL